MTNHVKSTTTVLSGYKKQLVDVVKWLQEREQLSTPELARRSGAGYAALRSFLTGRTKSLDAVNMYLVANTFGVTVEEIFDMAKSGVFTPPKKSTSLTRVTTETADPKALMNNYVTAVKTDVNNIVAGFMELAPRSIPVYKDYVSDEVDGWIHIVPERMNPNIKPFAVVAPYRIVGFHGNELAQKGDTLVFDCAVIPANNDVVLVRTNEGEYRIGFYEGYNGVDKTVGFVNIDGKHRENYDMNRICVLTAVRRRIKDLGVQWVDKQGNTHIPLPPPKGLRVKREELLTDC